MGTGDRGDDRVVDEECDVAVGTAVSEPDTNAIRQDTFRRECCVCGDDNVGGTCRGCGVGGDRHLTIGGGDDRDIITGYEIG